MATLNPNSREVLTSPLLGLSLTSAQKATVLKDCGSQSYRARDFVAALKKYDEAAELDPQNMVYSLNKAAVHMEMEDYPACIVACDRAIALGTEQLDRPGYPSAVPTSGPSAAAHPSLAATASFFDDGVADRDKVCVMMHKAYLRKGKASLLSGKVVNAEAAFTKAASFDSACASQNDSSPKAAVKEPPQKLPADTKLDDFPSRILEVLKMPSSAQNDANDAARQQHHQQLQRQDRPMETPYFGGDAHPTASVAGTTGAGGDAVSAGNTPASAPVSVPSPSKAQPSAGNEVVLSGLSNAKYNGAKGTVIAVTADGTRLIVKLDSTSKEIRVKPCHCTVTEGDGGVHGAVLKIPADFTHGVEPAQLGAAADLAQRSGAEEAAFANYKFLAPDSHRVAADRLIGILAAASSSTNRLTPVQLHSLVDTSYNGLQGEILQDKEGERILVRIQSPGQHHGEEVVVDVQNIRDAALLKTREGLAKETYKDKPPDPAGPPSGRVAPAASPPAAQAHVVGMTVTLVGLKTEKFNGLTGMIRTGVQPGNDRIAVRITAAGASLGKELLIKPANLLLTNAAAADAPGNKLFADIPSQAPFGIVPSVTPLGTPYPSGPVAGSPGHSAGAAEAHSTLASDQPGSGGTKAESAVHASVDSQTVPPRDTGKHSAKAVAAARAMTPAGDDVVTSSYHPSTEKEAVEEPFEELSFESLLQQFKEEDQEKKTISKKARRKASKAAAAGVGDQGSTPPAPIAAGSGGSSKKKKRKKKKNGGNGAAAGGTGASVGASVPTNGAKSNASRNAAATLSAVRCFPVIHHKQDYKDRGDVIKVEVRHDGPFPKTTLSTGRPITEGKRDPIYSGKPLKDDSSGAKAKLIKARRDEMEQKEKLDKLSLQDVADYEIFVQGLVTSMESDKLQIARKYRMAEAKLKLARDPKRVQMLSDEIDSLKRREKRFNEDVAIINQEVDQFHSSPAFKMARAHVLENFVEQGGTWVNKKTLEEDVVDFEALLKEMKTEPSVEESTGQVNPSIFAPGRQ